MCPKTVKSVTTQKIGMLKVFSHKWVLIKLYCERTVLEATDEHCFCTVVVTKTISFEAETVHFLIGWFSDHRVFSFSFPDLRLLFTCLVPRFEFRCFLVLNYDLARMWFYGWIIISIKLYRTMACLLWVQNISLKHHYNFSELKLSIDNYLQMERKWGIYQQLNTKWNKNKFNLCLFIKFCKVIIILIFIQKM